MRSSLPKVLHTLAFHPIIRYPLEALEALELDKRILVVGHGAQAVEEWVRSAFSESWTFNQQTEQKGTGHATQIALQGLEGFRGTVLILPGDVPSVTSETLLRVVDDHEAAGRTVTVVTAQAPNPSGSGRIIRNQEGYVVRIVEERDATPQEREIVEINTGVYAFDAQFLAEAAQHLETNNSQAELYLTDVVSRAGSYNTPVGALLASFEEFSGINTRIDLAAAERRMFERIATRHMEAGVTIHGMSTVFIDPDVELAPDVELGPSVTLQGKTSLGTGTLVEDGSIIRNSKIEENAHIKPYCVINSAHIGRSARVGPFAHLRPGAELGEKVQVGNYVEVKKSRLAAGAKANHLSYIGDAEIGEKVNVGAGTITCNYDGIAKHKTVIGRGAFIGSNTALVAPVTIGEYAIVGAGSTITTDVRPGALGITRDKQRNIDGYAARRSARKANEKS